MTIIVDTHGLELRLDDLSGNQLRKAQRAAVTKGVRLGRKEAKQHAPRGTRSPGGTPPHAAGNLRRRGFAINVRTRAGIVMGTVRFSDAGYYGMFVERGQGRGYRRPVKMMSAAAPIIARAMPRLLDAEVAAAIRRARLA